MVYFYHGRKVEPLTYVISPQRTDFVAESRETSTSDPPFKKRAVLYSVSIKPGGNFTTTENTSLTPAVTSSTAPVSGLNETPVTKVNSIQNTSDCNIEIDVVKSETSPVVGESMENKPQIVSSASASTINEESNGDLEKQSNLTVKEEIKYVTLITIEKVREYRIIFN